MSSAEDISKLFTQTGIMPGTLVGQNAVSKSYVDAQINAQDIDIAAISGATSTAQGTANTAVSAAGNAQSTANSAVSAAATAQTAANTAQSTVDTHKTSTVAHSAANITYSGTVVANNVKSAIDTQDQRISTIVAGAGASNTEILDARQPATGSAFPLLRDRLNNVDTQLAETATRELFQNVNSSSVVNIGSKLTKEALVTFIDDDGKAPVMTRLKPIFESRGVPCTLAIVSTFVGASGCCTRADLLSLQELGWEIASHEKTHIAMSGITDDEKIYDEIINSKKELLGMGFDVKNIVYPFGQTNAKVLSAASRAYKVGVVTGNLANDQTNQTPLPNYLLRRVALGSFGGDTQTLAHYKSMVDKAILEKSWLIFMTHIEAQDISQDDLLGQTIDYIKQQNVKIVNLDDGLDYFGDKLNIRDTLRITADDKVVSDKFVLGIYDSLINTSALASDMSFILANYGKNQVIYSKFLNSNAAGMPINAPGMLETHLETTEKGFPYQTYKIYDKDITYSRTYKFDTTWTPWKIDSFNTIFTKFVTPTQLAFGTVPAKSAVHVDVSITGLGYSHGSAVNAYYGLKSGLVANSATFSAGTLRISVTNVTDSAVVCDNAYWVITIFA